jgi:plasmid maintenance system antidote protein VapI
MRTIWRLIAARASPPAAASGAGGCSIATDGTPRFGRCFGSSPEFWLNLQARHELDVAERTMRRRIEREVSPRVA